MIEPAIFLPDLLLAYSAYIIATLSPGPALLAIAGTSMSLGRRPGLALAGGVISGSVCWSTLTALGLSAILSAFGWAIAAIKIGGGLYLFWLAYRSFRAAVSKGDIQAPRYGAERAPLSRHYLRGLAIHLTNPKAIFAWIAIIAIGLRPDAPWWVAVSIVAGCAVLGAILYSVYALAFSTRSMMRLYGAFWRWIEGAMALFFGFVGFKLLTARL